MTKTQTLTLRLLLCFLWLLTGTSTRIRVAPDEMNRRFKYISDLRARIGTYKQEIEAYKKSRSQSSYADSKDVSFISHSFIHLSFIHSLFHPAIHLLIILVFTSKRNSLEATIPAAADTLVSKGKQRKTMKALSNHNSRIKGFVLVLCQSSHPFPFRLFDHGLNLT